MLTAIHGSFGGSDFIECAADMNCGGFEAVRIPPRDRAIECPVDLEGPGAVAIAAESAPIACGKSVTGDRRELFRRRIEDYDWGVRQSIQTVDAVPCFDRAAEAFEISAECACDRLRAAASDRPILDVGRE